MVVVDMLDHVERADQVVMRVGHSGELRQRRAHDRCGQGAFPKCRALPRRARARRHGRSRRASRDCARCRSRSREFGRSPAARPRGGSARRGPRDARGTTSGGRRARPFAGRRRVPSAEHQLPVEREGRERGDEDRRDQRPPGRAVQRSGQQPGEHLVEQEARAAGRQELDLERDGPRARRGRGSSSGCAARSRCSPQTQEGDHRPPAPAASHRSRDTSRSPNRRRRARSRRCAKRTSCAEGFVSESLICVAMPRLLAV